MSVARLVDGFHHWSAAWGAWMWNMSWQVALVALVVALLTRLLRRRSAVALHALWLLVLVRLVLPPSFALPTGWGWWFLPPRSSAAVPSEGTPAATNNADLSRTPEAASPDRSVAGTAASPPRSTGANQPASTSASEGPPQDEPRGESQAVEAPPFVASAGGGSTHWVASLMLAWMGVAGTLLCLLAVGTIRVWNWVLLAEPLDDVRMYRLVEGCRRQLGIREPIELRNSDSCTTPVVVGIFRPVILLPRAVLSNLSIDELRAVLLHELVHVVRFDAIVNLAQGILGALYFFHPLVWWTNARLRELREEACDEMTVAALGGERKLYGEAIVKVTEIFGYASPPLALGVMESKNPARRRLSRILDHTLPPGERLGWKGLAALLALGAVLLPSAGAYTPENPAVTSGTSPAEHPQKGASAPKPAIDMSRQADVARAPQPPVEPVEAHAAPEIVAPPADQIAAATEIPLLRYRWKANQTYAFAVEIVADLGDETETLTGTPTYQVRNNHSESTQLAFYGRLSSSRQAKQPGLFRLRPPHDFSPFSRFAGVGPGVPSFPGEDVLSINDRGALQSPCGNSQLPYLLGNLSQLIIDPLPELPVGEWESSRKTTITLFNQSDDRFPGPQFGPFARQNGGEPLEARETASYKLEATAEGIATILKTATLASVQQVDGKPRVELRGTSRIAFDLEDGRPRSIDGDWMLTHQTANTTHRIPLKITIRRTTLEQQPASPTQPAATSGAGFGFAPDNEPVQDPAPNHAPEPTSPARRPALTAAGLDAALSELATDDPLKVQSAARRLARAAPGERQAEVARALEARLKDEDQFNRQEAARALAVWCDEDSLPALVAALDDEFFTVPWAAIEGLGRLRIAGAAAPLVALLKSGKHRDESRQALIQIGPAAEDEVAALLDADEPPLRETACEILESIGTDHSLDLLQQRVEGDDNARVERAARAAIEAIKSRKPAAPR